MLETYKNTEWERYSSSEIKEIIHKNSLEIDSILEGDIRLILNKEWLVKISNALKEIDTLLLKSLNKENIIFLQEYTKYISTLGKYMTLLIEKMYNSKNNTLSEEERDIFLWIVHKFIEKFINSYTIWSFWDDLERRYSLIEKNDNNYSTFLKIKKNIHIYRTVGHRLRNCFNAIFCLQNNKTRSFGLEMIIENMNDFLNNPNEEIENEITITKRPLSEYIQIIKRNFPDRKINIINNSTSHFEKKYQSISPFSLKEICKELNKNIEKYWENPEISIFVQDTTLYLYLKNTILDTERAHLGLGFWTKMIQEFLEEINGSIRINKDENYYYTKIQIPLNS